MSTNETQQNRRSDCSTRIDRLLEEHDAAGVMVTGPGADNVHLVGATEDSR